MWRVISAPRSDGTARIDRPFGVRTPAATENWRTAGETRPLLLAESHLTRRLFGAMVRRIEWLPLPAA